MPVYLRRGCNLWYECENAQKLVPKEEDREVVVHVLDELFSLTERFIDEILA
jgi:hypothetical protein